MFYLKLMQALSHLVGRARSPSAPPAMRTRGSNPIPADSRGRRFRRNRPTFVLLNVSMYVGLVLMPFCLQAQHDPGRNAVRLLAQGKLAEAEAALVKTPRKVNSPVSQAEQAYVSAMVACEKDDPTRAFEMAKEAVELGMPVERFAAGPRDVFQPLYELEEFHDWLEANRSQPIHGPILGAMTDRSVSVWVRTFKEADVRVVVRESGKGPDIEASGQSSEEEDFTAVVRVNGLEPDTEYKYRVIIDDEVVGAIASFRTFPTEGAASAFRFVFGGCSGYTEEFEHIWSVIGDSGPAALMMLGDNVYIDDPKHSVSQRYCYYRRFSQSDWRGLVAQTPVYAIYDDHDFGLNDCNPGPHIEKPAWKRQVWNVFRENWNNPAYGGGAEHPGCWFDFYIGDVHFIMLDGRYYRHQKGGSMLGPVQKQWLLETLKESKGTFKILASPVPFTPGVKPGSKDTWDGFNEEREEIFTFIEENEIEGVVLMAADRHRTDFRKIHRESGYPLYEMMSARLTNTHVHGLTENVEGSEWLMGYNEKCSFGLVEIDTQASDPSLKFSIVNIENEVIEDTAIRLSELSFN